MLTIVTYSYLILPLCFFLSGNKLKEKIPALIALYGIVFFSLLFFYFDTPKDLRKYLQAFYTFLEYFVFTLIFWFQISKKSFRLLMLIVSILFVLFQIFYVTTTSLVRLDSIPIGIETIFVFIYIFYFFYEFSKNIKDTYLYNHYCFWIAVGILIYLGGSFFFYLMINQLNNYEVSYFGNLTYIAELIKNALFAISVFMYKKYLDSAIPKKPIKIPNLDMF